jgi:hypothetical protein
VEWDQARLARLAEEIRTGGENPLDYLEIAFKVPERAYTAWPERIRKAFEPARTVHTSRPTYRLTLLSETAQRDGNAMAGPHPNSGGSN